VLPPIVCLLILPVACLTQSPPVHVLLAWAFVGVPFPSAREELPATGYRSHTRTGRLVIADPKKPVVSALACCLYYPTPAFTVLIGWADKGRHDISIPLVESAGVAGRLQSHAHLI
jgi:hypothetical protein